MKQIQSAATVDNSMNKKKCAFGLILGDIVSKLDRISGRLDVMDKQLKKLDGSMDGLWNEHRTHVEEFSQVHRYLRHLFDMLTFSLPENMKKRMRIRMRMRMKIEMKEKWTKKIV